MKLSLERADAFNADFEEQYRWCLEQAVEEIAERFLRAVAATLPLLAEQPNLGRRRKFRHPKLRGLRSFPAERPFQSLLIFYRVKKDTLEKAERRRSSLLTLLLSIAAAPGKYSAR